MFSLFRFRNIVHFMRKLQALEGGGRNTVPQSCADQTRLTLIKLVCFDDSESVGDPRDGQSGVSPVPFASTALSNSVGVHGSIFAPPPSLHPYHELPLAWQQTTKLLPVDDSLSPADIEKWGSARVADFVKSITSEECAAEFTKQVGLNIKLFKFFVVHDAIYFCKYRIFRISTERHCCCWISRTWCEF